MKNKILSESDFLLLLQYRPYSEVAEKSYMLKYYDEDTFFDSAFAVLLKTKEDVELKKELITEYYEKANEWVSKFPM